MELFSECTSLCSEYRLRGFTYGNCHEVITSRIVASVDLVSVMPSLSPKLTIEENVFCRIERGLTYFMYVIRQFFIFMPCLRAGI